MPSAIPRRGDAPSPSAWEGLRRARVAGPDQAGPEVQGRRSGANGAGGLQGQVLTTRTLSPHSNVRSTGSEVSRIVGAAAARAVAATMASIAYWWPCR